MSSLKPTSFRFTEDAKNKIRWTAETNGIKPVQLLTQLVEEQFKKDLDSKLQEIVTGKCVNPVEELVELLKLNFISKEYFMYSMSIPPKLRSLVLEKIKEST
jgi:hypothetical protein